MRQGCLILTVAAVLVAAAAAAAVITIELGLAFQSETDSSDTVRTGDFVKAYDEDGNMVSITPIEYIQSQDKETYQLASTTQEVNGTMEIWTQEDGVKGLRTRVTFQEQGTMMFLETMSITLQREICFLVMIKENACSSLSGITVIEIDQYGVISRANPEDSEVGDVITGRWMLWGVGTASNYTVKEEDSFNNFIILVDDRYVLPHHYNVVKISSGSNGLEFELYTKAQKPGDLVDSGEWMLWGLTRKSGYRLSDGDVNVCLGAGDTVILYDALTTGTGIAGKASAQAPVHTGVYKFTFSIKYKSEISINPEPYQSENMKSKVEFILSSLLT